MEPYEKKCMQRLARAQKFHEREMFRIKLADKERNSRIRHQIKVDDIARKIARLMWQWPKQSSKQVKVDQSPGGEIIYGSIGGSRPTSRRG